MKEFCLNCYVTDAIEAKVYIESHNGRVVDSTQDGNWLTVTYLAEKEL